MGQSFSSHPGCEGPPRRVPRLPELNLSRDQGRSSAGEDHEEGEQSLLPTHRARPVSEILPRLPSMATFRRQISAHSEHGLRGVQPAAEGTLSRDEIVVEQEERPLVSMEDLRIPDAPITDIRASPMPRRQPMWRLSRSSWRHSTIGPSPSQMNPRNIVVEQSLSDEAHHNITAGPSIMRPNRHSMFGALPRFFGQSEQSDRRRMAPISRPMPVDQEPSQNGLTGTTLEAPMPGQAQSTNTNESSALGLFSNRSRLSRVRRSISGPVESIIGSLQRNRRRESQDQSNLRPPRAEAATGTTPEETEYLLPPINIADPSINLEPSGDGRTSHDRAPSPVSPQPQVPGVNEDRPRSWALPFSSRASTPRRESRGINLLRGRSSRLIRRDDEAPLPRILQLAAAAIAAQLSGSTDVLANLESIGDDPFDGSLNNFVEELNSVASVGNDGTNHSDAEAGAINNAPLNFLRVFRFVSPADDHSARAPESDNTDARTVTLVVVGVRSVPSSTLTRGGPSDSGLDSLFGGPGGRVGTGSLLRNSLNRARLGRRSSITGSTPFPHQYDSQRHSRTRPLSSLSASGSILDSRDPVPGSSRQHSRTLSDPFTSSSSAAVHGNSGVRSNLNSEHPFSSILESEDHTEAGSQSRTDWEHPSSPLGEGPSDAAVRQRHRSVSESARHRNLGAGASRRNGTIDPDGGPVQGRSWLIYVVGTNLPEDHPAFTTPSLFTDNPSYEDMMLLSHILGPVKPPVASSDDVAASGGCYRIRLRDVDGNLQAQSIDDEAEIIILDSESCQVCLEAYAPDQTIRRLNKCAHVFHQMCVDEWLTTGRNSCPLCRGQGVTENSTEN